jgi:adenylate cyclase
VPTLAERLCESAAGGQILISRRVYAATESPAVTQPAGDLGVRGFEKPTPCWDLLGLET